MVGPRPRVLLTLPLMSLLSFQERVLLRHVFTIHVTEVRDELTTFSEIKYAAEGLSHVSTRP